MDGDSKERTERRQIAADQQKHKYSLHDNHSEQGLSIISKCGR